MSMSCALLPGKRKPVVRTLILISWDGTSVPLACLHRDIEPAFDIVLFNYSGSNADAGTDWPLVATLSEKTECKGQIFSAFQAYLETLSIPYDYVALIDDDIAVDVSSLNGAIELAAQAGLDSFSLSLTADSHVNHKRFVTVAGSSMRAMPWVEVMMPFYRQALYSAAAPFTAGSVSSYGVDQFVMPFVCKTTGMNHVALIDAYSARHGRPVTSDGRVYSNGLTAHQERVALRRRCLVAIRRDWPQLCGTRWFYATFAPLNGPARFWLLRLGWPWHMVQRLVSLQFSRQEQRGMHDGPK